MKLVVDKRVDGPTVGCPCRCDPLFVVERGGIRVVGGVHGHLAAVAEAVEVRADEPTIDVVRRDQLDVSVCIAESAGRKVRNIFVFTMVGRPIEDHLGLTDDLDRDSAGSGRRRLRSNQTTGMAVEAVAVVLAVEACLAPLARLQARLLTGDDGTHRPRRAADRLGRVRGGWDEHAHGEHSW